MLKQTLHQLRRVAAAQLRQAACAASLAAGEGGSSSSCAPLAAAWQQGSLQRHSWGLLQGRGFASEGEGQWGSSSNESAPGTSSSSGHGDDGTTFQMEFGTHHLGEMGIEDPDQALEQWGKAMDDGDWERAWDIFEALAPVGDDVGEFPDIEDMLAWDPDGEEKAVRRQREFDLQAASAARWVRKVDHLGRSHGVGKRKTSIARVWLKQGTGLMMVNKRPYDQYFPTLLRRNDLITPFIITDTLGAFDIMARVTGGGVMGQAQALRHGISRALQAFDPTLRPSLKTAGLLTRDARIVERKKPGLKKARKAFQWVKR